MGRTGAARRPATVAAAVVVGHCGRRVSHEETLEAVPAIIDGLRDRGFTFATVGEQFGGVLPGAGETVSHGPS